MKKVMLFVLFLTNCLFSFSQEKYGSQTINSDNLNMDDLFSCEVQLKDSILVGEPLYAKITLTYQGKEQIYIRAHSRTFIKKEGGNFLEIYWSPYDPSCEHEGGDSMMHPSDPIKLVKGDTTSGLTF